MKLNFKLNYCVFVALFLSNFCLLANDVALDHQAYSALKAAQDSNHYLINVLERNNDGKRQVVILVGETHNKTPIAGQEGLAIISNFNVIGIEAMPLNDDKARKEYSDAKRYFPALDITRAKNRAAEYHKSLPQSVVDTLIKEDGQNIYHSTIDDVVKAYIDRLKGADEVEEYFANLLVLFEKNFVYVSQPTSVAQLSTKRRGYLNSLNIKDEVIINENSLPKIMHSVRKKLLSNRLDMIYLEYNITKSWQSILDSASKKKKAEDLMSYCVGGGIISAVASHLLGENFPLMCLNTICTAAASTIDLYSGGSLNSILPKKIVIKNVDKNLVIRAQSERDFMMVDSILRAFTLRPELEFLPVIIGMAHNAGIKKILEDHSFTEISLESLAVAQN
jgi:hypothetical protein